MVCLVNLSADVTMLIAHHCLLGVFIASICRDGEGKQECISGIPNIACCLWKQCYVAMNRPIRVCKQLVIEVLSNHMYTYLICN